MLEPLDDLVHDAFNEENSESNYKVDNHSFSVFEELLNSSIVCDRLQKIADCVGSKDLNVWKWNEEKSMIFLADKVRRLERCLAEKKGLIAEDGSVEVGYSSKDRGKRTEPSITDQRYLRLAWEIVSDYLLDDISGKLAEKLKINLNESQSVPLSKKPKLEGPTSTAPDDDYTKTFGKKPLSQQVKKAPIGAKDKATSRASAGTKSITSFFTKK